MNKKMSNASLGDAQTVGQLDSVVGVIEVLSILTLPSELILMQTHLSV